VPEIKLVVCRQEGGAAYMADAYAKATGKPGICFVTRGPGITNASVGIHVAQQDSSPVIVFMGQVGRDMFEREAFQEVDVRKVFGSMTKWAAQIDDADRVPEFVSRAFYAATSGRPGPVVLALPEDMLVEETDAPDARPAVPVETGIGVEALARLRDLLAGAKRPLLLIGGEVDHTVPVKPTEQAYQIQSRNPGVTELVILPDRGHSLTIDHGWAEVAQTALDFIRIHT